MSSDMSVGIVIVNYNGAKFQNDCIRSLLKINYDNFKIIVVDNNSQDNSMDLLNEFKDERIVKVYLDDNYGVATGNNKGIEKSKELGMDFTLLLNNDTEVEPDFLEKMVQDYEPKCLVAAKMFYYFDKELLCYGGGKFVPLKASAYHLFDRCKDLNTNKYPKYCNYAPTTCLLVKNSDFDIIGLMDDDYFLYYDDVDFIYRACYKNGFKVKFSKDAVIYHKDGLSTKGKASLLSIYYSSRNKLYFVHKYHLSIFAKCYAHLTRRIKILLAKDKKEKETIKKAINDYKNKKMGRMS